LINFVVAAQRIRLDFESVANQNLNRLLDKPGYIEKSFLPEAVEKENLESGN